jgi:hypothetical protein
MLGFNHFNVWLCFFSLFLLLLCILLFCLLCYVSHQARTVAEQNVDRTFYVIVGHADSPPGLTFLKSQCRHLLQLSLCDFSLWQLLLILLSTSWSPAQPTKEVIIVSPILDSCIEQTPRLHVERPQNRLNQTVIVLASLLQG